uniref:Kunitz-type inhibitors n=1 Tax=Phalotris mertensi TaxID=1260334 RepID=A0A182C5R7_9SAUR
MSSGGLLLLLGLLTLWAELTPVSGKDQPEFCNLPPDTGTCRKALLRFYYNPASNKCEKFIYGGCEGNANRFKIERKCKRICVASP